MNTSPLNGRVLGAGNVDRSVRFVGASSFRLVLTGVPQFVRYLHSTTSVRMVAVGSVRQMLRLLSSTSVRVSPAAILSRVPPYDVSQISYVDIKVGSISDLHRKVRMTGASSAKVGMAAIMYDQTVYPAPSTRTFSASTSNRVFEASAAPPVMEG